MVSEILTLFIDNEDENKLGILITNWKNCRQFTS